MWPLYRFNPANEKPLTIDSKAPSRPVTDMLENEVRFTTLMLSNPEEAQRQRNMLTAYVQDQRASLEAMEAAQ
ncbi:hypothetical protein KIPB_003652 [Kipferlia bialata]|uniref:Uncharacterized protein n=1 Tax=Kipferlia bialata TaxID=797122 RepID=A0A391NK54_9EUKA|nr:hypothetical protein KIPB_003652 [Kipferlia bialata]|eukprot:g3652.t1